MKFKIIILFLILFQAVNSQSNTDVNISGNLVSLNSGQPIVHANIYFTNTFGTSTDTKGYYVLSFPERLIDSLISISAIGFVTKSISASDLLKNSDVGLEEDIFSLEEVVVTPLNAYPILKKVSENADKNYRTNWVSAKVKITEVIFFESNEEEEDGLVEYVASSKTTAKINFKGNRLDSQKWQVLNKFITNHFTQFDTLKKTFGLTNSVNLYDFFNKHEVSRKIKNLKNNNKSDDKNVFNHKAYKNNNTSRVIDFQAIDGNSNYIIATELVGENIKKRQDISNFNIHNKEYDRKKSMLIKSLKYMPVAKNKDSLVTEYLKKSRDFPTGITSSKQYFWVDTHNFGMTKYLVKREVKNSKTSKIFNKNYLKATNRLLDNKFFVKDIEAIFLQAKAENGILYKYIKMEFFDFIIGKGYEKILIKNQLARDYKLAQNYNQVGLDELTERELFDTLKKSPFFEGLIISDKTIIDFYKEF